MNDAVMGTLLGGRYRVESLLGRGGTSTVYRAQDEALGRPVAVKIFTHGSSAPAREEGELQVLSGLDHHSLVHLFDAGVDRDEIGNTSRYIVMAMVAGPTLAQRIHDGAISTRHVGEIGYDIAEALEYIHARNVIHRDIKPSNILLMDYGNPAQRARAKLTDFGIAITDDIERLTAAGATTGTAAYLSPEQVSGQSVGPASDVYALGLVMLECFTRTVEFSGGLVASAVARLSRDPRVPESLPDHWRRLLTSMTAREPFQRPVGSDLVAAIRQVVFTDNARHKEPTEPLFILSSADAPALPKPEMLENDPDDSLQHATALAARMFHLPIAVVSVVDRGRLIFKSYYGEEVEEIARQIDMSSTVAPVQEPVVIEDGRVDPRAKDSALVTGPLGLRFYVGVPLKRKTGEVIGTISVLGVVPGKASADEIANLEDIAALVVAQLEARSAPSTRTQELPDTVAMSVTDVAHKP
ncbi:hypothetical protein BH11ACT2_BH11ACT2_06150 [soil metagenome]